MENGLIVAGAILSLFVILAALQKPKGRPQPKRERHTKRAPLPPRERPAERLPSGIRVRDLSTTLKDSSHHWKGDGDFSVEVVGESHYQAALVAITQGHGPDGAEHRCAATLVPEDDSRYDPNAVMVQISGMTVGYLCREDAKDFRVRLSRKRLQGHVTSCEAQITGGGIRRQTGEKLFYGVWLDMKPF